MLQYRVIIEKDEEGVLVAKVPDLPGCATEGRTRDELMKNVKEAIQAYLEALKEHGDPTPIETVKLMSKLTPVDYEEAVKALIHIANVRFCFLTELLFENSLDRR